MFTGDNIAHFVWGDEQEDVYKTTKTIIKIIQQEIGLNIPIYPCLGNHEIVAVDEYISHKNKYFLNNMTEIFNIYLNEEAKKLLENMVIIYYYLIILIYVLFH